MPKSKSEVAQCMPLMQAKYATNATNIADASRLQNARLEELCLVALCTLHAFH